MVPPVRWYMLLSTWIFIISVLYLILYPLMQISTYPLNLMASVGCLEVVLNPYNEHALKNIYILFIHIAPFFWVPYDLSFVALLFAVCVTAVYLICMKLIGEYPLEIYGALLQERHETFHEFTRDRFGI